MNTAAAVTAVEKTSNRKTGDVSVTHVSQASCPDSCKLKGSGCYAETGMQAFVTRRLNKAETDQTRTALARAESDAIDGLSGKRPLRLHVVGDSVTREAVSIVASAASRYRERGGQRIWSYSHGWRSIPRRLWGVVSILASCETLADCKKALARGYAPALVVERFGSHKATVVDGVRLIPCPAQTHENTRCTDCRLCWNDRALLERRAAIVFEAHGSGAKRVREALAG